MLVSDGNGNNIEIEEFIDKETKIESLKKELAKSDYKVIKNMECQMAGLTLPYPIEELHISRQALRDKINELELELETMPYVAEEGERG